MITAHELLVKLSHLFHAEHFVKNIAANQGLETDCNLGDYSNTFRHV